MISNCTYFYASAVDKQIAAICESDSQCTTDLACLNRRCINPCSVNPCAKNAECRIDNHRRTCQCPRGYVGDPFINCYEGTLSRASPFVGLNHRTSFTLARLQKTWFCRNAERTPNARPTKRASINSAKTHAPAIAVDLMPSVSRSIIIPLVTAKAV